MRIGYFMYGLAVLFVMYEMMLQVSPSIMTFALMRDFDVFASGLGLLTAFSFYGYTVMQLPAGILFDHFSPKILLACASFTCAVGALCFSLTTDIIWAGFGRMIMGAGSAFAFMGVLVLSARWFKGTQFALFVGLTQLLAATGGLLGEILLAPLVNILGWRGTMFGLGIFGICLTITYVFVLKDRPKNEEHDVIEKERSLGRHLGQITEKFQTWAFALYATCGWGPMAIFASLWGIPFLMKRYDINNTHAAFAMTGMWLGIGLVSPFLGWLSEKLERRKPILWIGSLIGLISSLVVLYVPGIPFSLSVILLFFMGVGCAPQILTYALVRDINKKSVVGSAFAVNNIAIVVGGAVLQPTIGGILNCLWDGIHQIEGVPVYQLWQYQVALLFVPLLYLAGFFCAKFFINETYCKQVYSA